MKIADELDYKGFVEAIQKEFFNDNKENWVEQYDRYAKAITDNETVLKGAAQEIKQKLSADDSENTRLHLYTSINSLNRYPGNPFAFDIRYQGESIAEISVSRSSKTLKKLKLQKTKSGFPISEFIEDHAFDEYIKPTSEFDDVLQKFKKYFNTPKPRKRRKRAKNNFEHQYESGILTYLEKGGLDDLKPVEISNCRFQLPTKFTASRVIGGDMPYWCKNETGGGVDILAVHNGRFAVMELKIKAHDPRRVMKQAITYAVFLRRLLKKCPQWQTILGCHNIKEFDAVICMPQTERYKKEKPEKGASITYSDCGENVKINLNYIYFDYNKEDDKVKITESSYLDE